ncbi:unnamed protein product, partial [Mesorhabditis belari]|uniref:Uncharacterized protein n=1 Tax=Mesorhabditis belari TaxID=2138241 RepID=A0AAF3J3A0_9BILA
IIERQTFRPPEPTPGPSSNPLLKAVWGNGDRPFLALAGTQHIKIFNVLHDLDHCVEELVLPVGNVVDLLVDVTEAGGPKVAVLSSQGHLYIHQMQDRDVDDQLEVGSFFLTNNVNLPQVSTAISMHYSKATQLLFVSNTSATFYAQIPNGDLGKLATEHFKRLQVSDPLHCWHESDGLLSAIHHTKPTLATFIYPTMKTLLTQQIELEKAASSHVLWTNPTANGHLSVFLLNDPIKRCAVFTSNWNHERDLWIADFPREIRSIDESEEKREESVQETPQEDLVTIFEFSTPITRVSFSCDALKQYYDPDDLTKRLSTVGSMPVTILQKEDIEMEVRVQEWNVVVRAIRIEVSTTRCPAAVTFLDGFYPLQCDATRSHDIKLTRQQSLALEKSFLLKFHHSTNPFGQTAITSIQLFGVSRGEFDWPSPTRCLTSPLTLPQRFLTRLIDLYTNTIGAGIEYKASELPVHLGAGACAPRAAHSQLSISASTLLRTAVPSLNDYYNYRDRAIFNDFREFHFLGVHSIPMDILPVYINHIKLMLSTRVILYEKIVKEMFNDTMNFCQFLAEQLGMISGDSTGLIELYVLVVFHALSTGNPQKNEIEERYLELFTNQKTSKHSSKLRIVSQRLIQTFVGVSRADRNLAKGFGANRRVLKNGGALPFYTVSKLIDEDGDYKEIEKRMGKTISANELGTDDRDLFEENKECGWVLSLLKKTIEKIAGKTRMEREEREENEENDEEMDGMRRIERLRPDSQQANALIAMSIVLLAQLPSKLVVLVSESLIKMIDFNNQNLLEPQSENFRQLLLLRIISVLLQKWEEMNDRKARSPLKFSKEISHPSEENESEDGDGTREATPTREKTPRLEPTREKTPRLENDTSKLEKKKELYQLCSLLIGSGCIGICLQTLQQADIYWKSWQEPDRVLKRWMRDYEKGQSDLLNQYPKHWACADGYHLMVTDCVLRLPYLLHKNLGVTFANEWNEVLCQLMLSCSVGTVRRLTRKLLIAINDNDKNKYRLVKSRHVISGQIAQLNEKLNSANGAPPTHSQLTQMVEIVNKMSEAATERPQVWREIACEKLSWLLSIACQLPDAVSGNMVDLLVTAIRALPQEEQVASTDCLERENDDLIECQLADQLISQLENLLLFKRLLVRYLLGKDEQKRWMLHGMVRSTIQLASRNNQVTLVKILWSDLWPLGRSLGTLGAQLGDLLSTYTPRLLPHADLTTIMEQEVNAIAKAQKRLHDCGHDSSSRQMSALGLGWREAMLIDTSPCLVCTSRQVG